MMKKHEIGACTASEWPKNEEDMKLKQKFEEAFFEDTNELPWGNGSKCCHYFGQMFGKNLKGILTLMKYSTLNGRTFDNVEELVQDFGNLTKLLNFSQVKDLTKLLHPSVMQVREK